MIVNFDLFDLDFSAFALIICCETNRTESAQHLGVRYARQGIIQRRFTGN